MSKKTSRIIKLVLILLIGILAVYNAIKPGDNSGAQGEQNTSQIEQTLGTTEHQTTTEPPSTTIKETVPAETTTVRIKENGTYTSKEDVAEYLHIYGHLPSNYITKDEAKELGWVSSEGNLWEVAPGKSIGGDYFGNYEGLLPKKSGRKYYECDIDFDGSYRGAKRIIYSSDGLIYYTEDHYESFEQLYGE